MATAEPAERPARLTFVTGNAGKAAELQAALPDVEVVQDARGYPEIQADRLEDVAASGARFLLEAGLEPPFVLEDAGLFVEALQGFPGVYSRYALDTIGLPGLLALLRDLEAPLRKAAFQACLTYVDDHGHIHAFTGRCEGRIGERPLGDGGFGYDPVFVPAEGDGRTFAQMPPEEKERLGHRGRAARALADFLQGTA